MLMALLKEMSHALTSSPQIRDKAKHLVVIKDKETVLVEIDATNVFTDTKTKLADATKYSLMQLKPGLEKEIKDFPESCDAKKFKEMLDAINELLEEKKEG